MRIIITRHGETEENQAGIIQGHLPGVLSDLGKEQARKLADRLKSENIDLIVSSDLARAVDTAKEVGKFHPEAEILFDERLRERYLGEFQGRTWDEVGFVKGQSLKEFIEGSDAEVDRDMLNRAKELIDYIISLGRKNILVVGHMGICTFILSELQNKNIEEVNPFMFKNTSVSEYFWDGKKWSTGILNCTRHLDEN